MAAAVPKVAHAAERRSVGRPGEVATPMRRNARVLLVFFAVLLGTAGCDHASKRVAITALAGPAHISVAGGVLQLELASNPGAFLSLGARLPEPVREFLFLGAIPLLVLWLCVHCLRAPGASIGLSIGVGLIAGGGLANWLDRLLHSGVVTDFLLVGVGPLHTGVFNLADVAVVAGVAVLATARRSRVLDRRQAV